MKRTGMNMERVKQQNRSLILNYICSKGPVSRKEIALDTGLTAASVTQIVSALISDKLLVELGPSSESAGTVGRKKILIDIRSDAEFFFAVNIEPDETNIALCDLKGYPVKDRSGNELISGFATDNSVPAEVFLDRIAEECRTLSSRTSEARRKRIKAVSVGISGIVDIYKGISVQAYGIWKDPVDIRSILGGKLDLPVMVENNVDAFAIAALLFGTGRGQDNLLIIKWGPGVGSTIVIDDRIYRGRHGKTAEIGHTIMDPNGSICNCGRRGCLETKVSYRALRAIMPSFTPETFEESYEKASPAIKKQIDGAIDLFARSIVNTATIVAPRRIVLFGKMFRIDSVRNKLIEHCKAFDPAYSEKRILHTTLSDREMYVGPAAAYVQNRLQNFPAFAASSTETATDTVIPTIGLFPAPIRPIISTCAGTEEDPAN